jgi:hypothetical protein
MLSAMEAGLLPGKRTAFSFSHWRINTGSLLKIESSKFFFWGGGDVMVYVISWRRSSRVQSLAQGYYRGIHKKIEVDNTVEETNTFCNCMKRLNE